MVNGTNKTDIHTRAHEIADELRGQCLKSLDDVTTERERNNRDLMSEVDSLVFECSSCGWWCGEDEMADDDTCDECA